MGFWTVTTVGGNLRWRFCVMRMLGCSTGLDLSTLLVRLAYHAASCDSYICSLMALATVAAYHAAFCDS
jgi:hypothetical protein